MPSRNQMVPGTAITPPTSVQTMDSLTAEQRAAWAELARTQRCGYFTTPLWCAAWIGAFSGGGQQQVALWEDAGELVAVAPMVKTSETLLPSSVSPNLRVPVWQVIGAGIGGADHVSFACKPQLRESVVGWVRSLDGTLRLHNLTTAWAAEFPEGRDISRVTSATFQIELRPETERPGSKQLWSQLGRRRRRLAEQGVEFSVRTGQEVSATLLADLITLHQQRSAVMNRRSSFTMDRLDFHLDLARTSTEAQCSVMVCATIGEELVGALYGFLDDRTFAYYQSGWAPRFGKWSMGAVVMAESIVTARSRGAQVFDLLRGDEPYKLRFGAELVENTTVTRFQGPAGPLLRARDGVSRYQEHRRAGNGSVGDPAVP